MRVFGVVFSGASHRYPKFWDRQARVNRLQSNTLSQIRGYYSSTKRVPRFEKKNQMLCSVFMMVEMLVPLFSFVTESEKNKSCRLKLESCGFETREKVRRV